MNISNKISICRKRRKISAYRGFTLIELLIVLVIMATFSVLIVPSMASAMRNRTLAGTGRNIEQMIEFARMSAIARRRPAVLNLDSQRRICWVSTTEVSLPWLEQVEERGRTRDLAVIKLPDDVECAVSWGDMASEDTYTQTEWQTLTFRRNGTTDDVYIELSKPGEEKPYIITVMGTTGEITRRETTI